MADEIPRGRGVREGPLGERERHPQGPGRGPEGPGWAGDLPERGLACNVCGDLARDRASAMKHRERNHPDVAGGVHARG